MVKRNPGAVLVCGLLIAYSKGKTMRQLGMGIALFGGLVTGLIGLAEPSVAKVVKFEIIRIESPAFEGRVFGPVGTYDRIIAAPPLRLLPTMRATA